ncbi:TIGR04282 family arsenosugar biosynthesis glycosyltransferase [Seonamhaeicola sp. MEBiC1930]|uniref:TIGR04282 family arsenosugar biosynthesis glycosyltransferase n=1 Tax=Seonamhaeicola sp. MEBiC01930 TaxID=2976768 RepID=UPI00324FA626
MSKDLVIVFVKNAIPGKVKTRLAKTIGNQAAFEVYNKLVEITEKAIQNLNIDKRIYFSDAIVESEWVNNYKDIQKGKDLGERMKNAFLEGFLDGYKNIILIGSDLPDISAYQIEKALSTLQQTDTVFGPAQDGGYYLIGLSKMVETAFNNKPWSQNNLLEETLKDLTKNNITFSTLETLNDIDTFEDLKASKFYKSNKVLQEKIKALYD